MQLDGGHSTQLSYIDNDGKVKSPVDGIEPGTVYRDVPHYFVIWG
jgi:hypothetical protein